VSEAYGQILNLIAAARCHKRECDSPECGVSLSGLGRIARTLTALAAPDEALELAQMIDTAHDEVFL
jgi:hypothetical protein